MRQKRQAGFSIIILFVILVAIGATGFLAWRIFSKPKIQQMTSNDMGDSTVQKIDPNAGYVVLKEWNVRFKPTDGLVGVKYFRPTNAAVGIERFDFSTDRLANLEPHCAEVGFSSIQRTSTPLSSYEKSLGKIGEHYYYYFGAASACSQNKNNFTLESETRQLIQQSVTTLEAAR